MALRGVHGLAVVALLAAGVVSPHLAAAQATPERIEMAPVQTGPLRRVIILFADRLEAPATQLVDRGLRSALTAGNVGNLQIYPEYLDVTRFPRDNHYPHVDAYLRRRYADVRPDVVLAVGEPALDFLLRFGGGLYPGTPIVVGGVERRRVKTWPLPPGVTGSLATFQVRTTIELFLRLHPDTARVVLAAGTGNIDRFWAGEATREIRALAPRVEIVDFGTLPVDEMLRQAAAQPPHTVILGMPIFRDIAGQTFVASAVVGAIAEAANAPTYVFSDGAFGRGVVGGHVYSFEAHGEKVARIALRALKGEPVAMIPVSDEDAYVYMFDARQLKRWGIDERRLPPDSVVRFREPTPWDVWKWYAIGGLVLLALQSATIVGLLAVRAARRRAQRALADRLRFEALLSELSAAFVASPSGRIDDEIDQALARIVDEMGLDRAGLGELVTSDDVVRVTHVAVRPGVPPVGVLTLNAIPWIVARLRAGQALTLRSPAELPPEADADRRRLIELGTRSLALVPLMVGGATVGALSLVTVHAEREWAPDLVQRMQLLAEVFANALARRDADHALRESEARFRSMADTAPVMIWMSGLDQRSTFFNTTWLAFTGRTLAQELGDGWLQSVHPDDVLDCTRASTAAFGARREFTLEYRLRRHDGRHRHVLDRGTPRFTEDGTFVGYIGCAYDVTDLKQAEEQPRRVLEAAPNAMIMVTRAGRITLVNAAAERVFGYARQELIGQPIELLIPERFRDDHPAHWKDFIAAPATRSIGAGRELYGRRRDGHEVPVEIGLTPIEAPDGLFVLASIVDITARKDAELEAERHRAELAHVTRIATAGELATSLAHELNQPLTAILANAQAAQRFLRSDAADLGTIRDILKDIVEDNSRAGDVIHRLRALVRKDAPQFTPVHVGTVVNDVFALVRSDAILRGNRIVLEVATGLPTVLGDRVQLQQVLLNLLLNAFDAMKGMPADRRQTIVRGERNGGNVVKLAVVDRGIGLSAPMLEQVFQPFFTTKHGGLGMGLSISRSIIHAHGGRLWAENNTDTPGVTFAFTLPVDAGAPRS